MRDFSIILLVLIIWIETYASGKISMGIMAGASNDAGNISKIAGDINSEMREYQIANSGTEVTEIETTYTPLVSLNFSFVKESLLIKAGWEYTTNSFYKSSGSIQPSAGSENKIELDYTRFTFPVSFGMVIPLTGRDRIYLGGGLNISYFLFKITQTDPGLLALYPDKSHTYSAFIGGTHVMCGAETVLSRNYSFTIEFTKFFGNPSKVQSEDENSEMYMSINSFEITAGINYNINFKIL